MGVTFAIHLSGMRLISKVYEERTQLSSKNKLFLYKAEGQHTHFSKENTPKANRDVKRCSMLLVMRKRLSKTTMRHHLEPSRMLVNRKDKGQRMWTRWTRVHCRGAYPSVRPRRTTVRSILNNEKQHSLLGHQFHFWDDVRTMSAPPCSGQHHRQ